MVDWPPGPWDTEPKEGSRWVDVATGIECETSRHPKMGHWCGYIYADEHMLLPFKTEYGYDIPGAHGGITFEEAQPDGTIKVGFDCAHAWDNSPTQVYSNGEYRSLEYVRECLREMARAVKAEQGICAIMAGV